MPNNARNRRKPTVKQNFSPINIKPYLKKAWFFIKKVKWAVLSVAVLVLLYGGVQYNQFFNAHAKDSAANGGTITHGVVSQLKELSPLAKNPTKADEILHTLLYRGLLKYNPQTGLYEDDLGEFQVNEDRTQYTIRIKSSSKFSNGDAITVDDVLFTFKEIIQNENFPNPGLKQNFEYITITQKDDETIVFQTPEPYFYFPALLTTPVLHAKSFQNAFLGEILSSEFPGNRFPVSSGFFKLDSLIPDQNGSVRVFLERNTHASPRPYVERIVLHVYPNEKLMTSDGIPKTQYHSPQTKVAPELKTLLEENYRTIPYVLPRWTGLFFQLDRKHMGRNSLRKALALTVPKSDIIEENWGTIDSVFFFEGVVGSSGYNPAQARDLLNKSGITFNQDTQKRELSDGNPLELTLLTSTQPSLYSRMAQRLKREWERELNLNIDFQVLPPDEFDAAVLARNYDILLFGTHFGENPDTMGLWHSVESGKLNLSNLTNQGIDDIILKIHQQGHQEDLFTLASRLENLYPAVPLATPTYKLHTAPELLGTPARILKPRTHSDWFLLANDWYIHTKKALPLEISQNKWQNFWNWKKNTNTEQNQENTPTAE